MPKKVILDSKLTGLIGNIRGISPELEIALRIAALDNGAKGKNGFVIEALEESPKLAPYLKQARKELRAKA